MPACCLSAAGNAVSGKGRQRIMTETKDYVRKVQYYETDRMGIVHHSNYIRWMEEARTDVLEQIGLPYDKIERAGILTRFWAYPVITVFPSGILKFSG